MKKYRTQNYIIISKNGEVRLKTRSASKACIAAIESYLFVLWDDEVTRKIEVNTRDVGFDNKKLRMRGKY